MEYNNITLLKMGSYSNTTNDVSVLVQSLNLLSSVLTILLTCPNSNTLLCYSNGTVLTVQKCINVNYLVFRLQ